MKLVFVLICCTWTVVYAESRVLPPVIDSSIYSNGGGRAASSGAPSPSVNAMYEVMGRLEQMQLELQQLRGVVEEQSKTIFDLKQRQNNIYSDLDLRIQELSRTQNGVASVGGPAATRAVSAPTSAGSASDQAVVVPTDTNEQSAAAQPAEKATTARNEKEAYQAAYETLRNGHNDRAIADFEGLLKEFPDGEYADNSQYWLGEAYKVNQNLESAKLAFTKVVSYHPMSPKVPDALLKLGYIELEQSNTPKARDYFTKITVNYPGTTAAHLAEKKLMELGVMQ